MAAREASTAAELAGQMPGVTPGAAESEGGRLESDSAPRDRYGHTFDPARHQSNEQGEPRLTKTGKLTVKPGVGKKHTGPPTQASTVPPLGADGQPLPGVGPTDGGNFAAIGALTAQNITALCTLLMGAAWKPEKLELESLSEAWASYYQQKGITDVSPLLLLFIVHGGYAGKRIVEDEETITRISRARKAIGARIRRMRRRGTQPDPGDDAKRQDGAGEPAGAGVSLPTH